MPSNRLGKVQKHVAKKKGKNAALHENSRDTQRLQSASLRDNRLNKLAALREKQNRRYLQRVKFFQSSTTSLPAPPTLPEIQALIEDYLGRDDEELAQLKADRRPGRPPSTRETVLEQSRATEQGEYVSGFWIPDLGEENLKKLRNWDGKWAGLAQMKFVRVNKEGKRSESSFPPKGLS
ncbi:hypothetical protein M011DRAFT_430731 [Sporormia fimetaria CBS 119925]|uniref:Translation machinery-associated protein 16 n=1 Tax=Sporormia fimetaria CBS 119925 TaxID=1340428 RepID=A0A6A6V0W5_9PLEO|nr:hypothetical protein M011DRAFT_430731 [Sporormia fimetaria CBS 119925]